MWFVIVWTLLLAGVFLFAGVSLAGEGKMRPAHVVTVTMLIFGCVVSAFIAYQKV